MQNRTTASFQLPYGLYKRVKEELVDTGDFQTASEAWRYAMQFFLDWRKIEFSIETNIRELLDAILEWYKQKIKEE